MIEATFSVPPPALAAFLASTNDIRHKLGATLDVKHAHAFRRVELVARHGKEIDVAPGDMAQVDFARGLHRIGMKEGRPLRLQIKPISSTGKRTPVSLFAHMIETMPVSSRIAFSTSESESVPSAWTGRRVTPKTHPLELVGLVHDGRMLDLGRDDVPFARGLQRRPDGHVVALRAATGENNLSFGVEPTRRQLSRAPLRGGPRRTCQNRRRWKDCRNTRSGTAPSPRRPRGPRAWWHYCRGKTTSGRASFSVRGACIMNWEP